MPPITLVPTMQIRKGTSACESIIDPAGEGEEIGVPVVKAYQLHAQRHSISG
jgi:hypothetical protein